jgi:anti-sigma regulatory factor (Ser/Thr protein kinase)
VSRPALVRPWPNGGTRQGEAAAPALTLGGGAFHDVGACLSQVADREKAVMEVQPPFLFARQADSSASSITVVGDVDASVIDVAVHGAWDRRLRGAVPTAISKCLAERPTAVIVDLTDITDPATASVPAWLTAGRAAATADPPVRLVLCVPPGSALADRLILVGAERTVPVYATPQQARTELDAGRGRPDVLRLRLAPSPLAPSLARNLVGQACEAWNLAPLLHPGRAVMSELVTNAVEHARTDMDVSVSRRGTALHIAVRDHCPTLPRMLEPAPVVPGRPLDEHGNGLRVVHADSVAWGAMPTADGKVVWATVRDRGGRPRRW